MCELISDVSAKEATAVSAQVLALLAEHSISSPVDSITEDSIATANEKIAPFSSIALPSGLAHKQETLAPLNSVLAFPVRKQCAALSWQTLRKLLPK